MVNKTPKRKRERIKTVKVTTEITEHRCTAECFATRCQPAPEGLRKLSLGEIYQDRDGRFYHEWGEDGWLEVTGVTFLARADGEMGLMFHPKEQLHLHSPGGRTVARRTTERDVRTNADYHAVEAAKKLKRKNLNLRQSQDFLRGKAAEVIPHAPKRRKPVKGIGRGAPGQPRSATAREIVCHLKEGKSQGEVLKLVIDFAQKHSLPVAGPHRRKIKKQIRFWAQKVDR